MEIFDCLNTPSEVVKWSEGSLLIPEKIVRPTTSHIRDGAPGIILQMPQGCGAGKDVVAKSLVISSNQSLPTISQR